MDKHITGKHKIQNLDGQTHNRETLKTQIVMDKYMSKIYHPLSYKQQHVGVTIILVIDG